MWRKSGIKWRESGKKWRESGKKWSESGKNGESLSISRVSPFILLNV
jgi:hypothetical protein